MYTIYWKKSLLPNKVRLVLKRPGQSDIVVRCNIPETRHDAEQIFIKNNYVDPSAIFEHKGSKKLMPEK